MRHLTFKCGLMKKLGNLNFWRETFGGSDAAGSGVADLLFSAASSRRLSAAAAPVPASSSHSPSAGIPISTLDVVGGGGPVRFAVRFTSRCGGFSAGAAGVAVIKPWGGGGGK